MDKITNKQSILFTNQWRSYL